MPTSDYFLRINSPKGKEVYFFLNCTSKEHLESFTTKSSAAGSCVPPASCGLLYFQLRTQRWKNLSVNLQQVAFNNVYSPNH